VKLLYTGLVGSHLKYGNVVVWLYMYKKDIDLVERVQRRATSMVPWLEKLSYEKRHKTMEYGLTLSST